MTTPQSPPDHTTGTADLPPIAVALEIAGPTGSIIRGQRWGTGRDAAILLHEPGRDLDAWADLPALLAQGGLLVLAIDLPGHGLSDDPWQPDDLDAVLRALIDVASTAGAGRIFLIAAGPSATVSLLAPGEHHLAGLIALSPSAPTDTANGSKRPPARPKLILVGAHDATALADARTLANRCPGWTIVSTIPTAAQGTRLLEGEWGRQVREQIVAFLRDCRSAPTSDRRPTARPMPDGGPATRPPNSWP